MKMMMRVETVRWLAVSLTVILFSGQCCCENITVTCKTPGELVPNIQNCRKYYKCSNGDPSLQSCPGTLIFDPVLKICNWPDSTTCISDLLGPSKRRVKLPGFVVANKESSPATPSPTPVIVSSTTPANKLSKRILSLFQSKHRKPSRYRTGRPGGGESDKTSDIHSRRRVSAFKPKNDRNTLRDLTTTTTTTTTTEKPLTERQAPRIRPFKLLATTRASQVRKSPVLSRAQVASGEDQRVDDKAEKVEEDMGVSVRKVSSVSSITSSVRVSVREGTSQLTDERPFSNGRGGDQFEQGEEEGEEGDYLSRIREQVELSENTSSTTARPKAKPIKCHTGASNELYGHPRNCRKYYKCQNGEPSLQSCPANLIFDRSLRICNWPSASQCLEDPEAPLPDHVTSDREPPPALNTINIDDYESEEEVGSSGPSVSSLPHPGHATEPTEWEARRREEALKAEYPQFAKVKDTVRTLDTKLVEKVRPGDAGNPDNVKRVEFILSEENYEDLFPRRHPSYTYRRLLQAIAKFPAICAYVGKEEASDMICRRTLATMFAHFTQETGAHNPSDTEYDEWRQGLNVVREQGCTDTSPGCGYNDNCEDTDSITRKWSCGRERSGKWRKYFGRGAKQLSYNFNYGQFSQAMFGDRRLLLDHPDFVADTWLNLASATWFYTTPQPPKPSMLHVIDGTWVPNEQDRRNGISPGFGSTINIINGGVECNTKDGRESKQARNRIEYYKQFAWYLYVDYQEEELGCAKQSQFSAGGAGALPIYWDKDWSFPFSCKLVNYQTAHSALMDGEYLDCVEENFKIKIRN